MPKDEQLPVEAERRKPPGHEYRLPYGLRRSATECLKVRQLKEKQNIAKSRRYFSWTK